MEKVYEILKIPLGLTNVDLTVRRGRGNGPCGVTEYEWEAEDKLLSVLSLRNIRSAPCRS